jgi:hypothetical protein
MASFSNYLPGARKGVPYIVETSKYVNAIVSCNIDSLLEVGFFWKMIELNKVCSPLKISRLIYIYIRPPLTEIPNIYSGIRQSNRRFSVSSML